MDERLVEIIIAIVDKLADREIPSKTVEGLTSSLVADGYSIGEINTAFMWLYHTVDESFFEEGRILAEYGSKSTLRMLNDFEKSLITPQAYGYILQLSQLGLLDDLQIEDLIERAIFTCVDSVELNDVKRMVPTVILEGVPGFRPRLISWRSSEPDGSLSH
ncbi:MAG: DUF494 family protein [Candidatus Eisenbacteria bacterium]